MIDLLFVALLQAAAGDPATPPETTAPPGAEQPAAQQSETAEAEETQPPRRRCRNEPVLGSRFPQRICTTAAQDREMANESRELVNRAQSQMPLQGN